ncbi:enolase C-terminal domain-like protein [Streptomyces sp. NPDC050625]|uniref:mandelate racemase/muconate lactonizing enzyme family protein n=1 Tax=Streptomyces sp. NPDC050625 TaxID=3154629 RepID=UPI003413AAA5
MKIVRVEAIPSAIPYARPLQFASGEVHTADHVLVRVHTDEGLTGIAEAPPRPYTSGETQGSIIAVIDKIFAPQLIGLTALEREPVHARLDRTVSNPTAKAAIEAEAERIRDTYGITTFKVKVGRQPYSEDATACRALRAALGADVELYINGNRGWTASDSARALREMADVGLSFAEELCPADDVLGRRWLVAQSPVPFIADESATRAAEVTRELLGGSATAISIKTARTGFTSSQRALHECEGLGAEVVMGNQIDSWIGTLCSVAFGAAHRSASRHAGELSNFLDMTDDLLTEPLTIDGTLRIREDAGLGIDIDPDKLARYRLDN